MESAGAPFLEELPVKGSNPTCEGVRNDPVPEDAAVVLMKPVMAAVELRKPVMAAVGDQDILLWTAVGQSVSRGPSINGTVNEELSPDWGTLRVSLKTVRLIMPEP
jgi:hypothetical protein